MEVRKEGVRILGTIFDEFDGGYGKLVESKVMWKFELRSF